MRITNGTDSKSRVFEWNLVQLIQPDTRPVSQRPNSILAIPSFSLIVLNQPLQRDLSVVRRLWKNGMQHLRYHDLFIVLSLVYWTFGEADDAFPLMQRLFMWQPMAGQIDCSKPPGRMEINFL